MFRVNFLMTVDTVVDVFSLKVPQLVLHTVFAPFDDQNPTR